MSKKHFSAAADDGFTLMEAIAALVIFASVVVVLQVGFASGLRAIRSAQKERVALNCAKSVLNGAGATQALTAGQSQSGACDSVEWAMDVEAHDFKEGGRPPPPLAAYWVNVRVRWRDVATSPSRDLHLRTLKVVRQE